MFNLVVVSNKNDLQLLEQANFLVVDVNEYLSPKYAEYRRAKVFNLCRDYSYCKRGYYVSLIAEARGHRPIPSVSAIMDFGSNVIRRGVDDRLNQLIQHELKSLKGDHFELSIYFGKNLADKYSSISRYLFGLIPAPLLRASFVKRNKEWILSEISPISLNEVPPKHLDFLISSMNRYFRGDYEKAKSHRKSMKYDLAILVNPKAQSPPSNAKAIKKFIQAGAQLRIHCEIIEPKEITLLSRFDALFIRETTSVNDHTYRFAQRAQSEGLVVIDDPLSIIRCCNKVYLNDLLIRKKVPIPKTEILIRSVHSDHLKLSFPIVIKKPDSSFSAGVELIHNAEDLKKVLSEFYKSSDLVILQEFLRSDYDWRIGLIDGQPLFVCKYYMAKDHWQVINKRSKRETYGEVECFAIPEVPDSLIRLAKKACESIGTGLYGVDIKEVDGNYCIIEINDNPNIDAGVEDQVAGDSLYLRIMSSFLRRIEMR